MKPYVALYHNVVDDNEIDELLNIRHDTIKYDRTKHYASKTIQVELNPALHNRLKSMSEMNMDFDTNFVLQFDGLAVNADKQKVTYIGHLKYIQFAIKSKTFSLDRTA